jgi:site-specific recombinase XerD
MKDNLAPVYCRISIDSRRVEISLKKSIATENWNDIKGMARGSRPVTRAFNRYLDEVKARLIESYHELQIEKQLITAETVKNRFLGVVEENENTLCKLMEYHNTEQKVFLAWGTLKNYFTTQKYIHKFLQTKLKRNDINLDELNYKFLVDFEIFLRTLEPEDHHKPLTNNGVMKHIERLRKMTNMAVRLDWLDKDPFSKFKQKFVKVTREFLTTEELERIEKKVLSIPRLEWVRDLFVFSCYSGLAYIDVMHLTTTNLSVGIDGEQWLITDREKTGNPVRVPLLPQALELIKKYQGHPRASAAGTLFPVISNQKLNGYLKELADLCGVEKNLTFHIARHTFATTITLTNGVPIESVSKMLGHSSITTTQIYAKVVETKLSQDMKALKNKLNVNLDDGSLILKA